MEKETLKELIKRLEQDLIRMGYKEATLAYYRSNWARLIGYFESRGEETYSETIAMEYVDSKCDFFVKEQRGELTQSNIYLLRIVRMIGDFRQSGVVSRRYMRSLSRVNMQEHIELMETFGVHCKTCDYSVTTQKSYRRITENFLSFLEARSCTIKNIVATDLTEYVKTLMGYSYKTVEFTLCGIRVFLRFLHSAGCLSEDLSGNVPHVKSRKHTRIPSLWPHEDLQKLLDTIDRGNPSGKRDYAMILLVARLGLRSIDVKNLKLSDIKWSGNKIEFVQSKTHDPVSLPLLRDAGWAIIDYLKNGRPASDCPNVFLRHLAPVMPFSDEDHLHQIIVKYMRLAGLPISGKKKVGMHSLRHTLATTLLENHSSLQEIADILGHQDIDSTAVYLKSSLALLRECSLNPEEL